MKKVINTTSFFDKSLLKKLKVIWEKIKLFFMIMFLLPSAGCAEAHAANQSKLNIEPTASSQLVNDGVDEEKTPEPVILPTSTPMDPSFITPEPTATPIKETYFIFFPSEEESSNLEIASKDLEIRLSETTNGNISALSLANYSTLEISNLLSANFEQLIKDPVINKETILYNINNFINGFVVTISYCGTNVANGKTQNIKIINPQFYKIYEVAGAEKYSGVNALKLFEDNAQAVYEAGLKNSDDFTEKAQSIINIMEEIFISNSDNEKLNNGVVNFYNMHPLIKLILLKEVYAISSYISSITGSFNLKAYDDSKYNLYSFWKIVNSDETKALIEQEIMDLMDAYIAIVEQGSTYDAYMTGDSTRKETIKQLMLNNDNLRLY